MRGRRDVVGIGTRATGADHGGGAGTTRPSFRRGYKQQHDRHNVLVEYDSEREPEQHDGHQHSARNGARLLIAR
jgi:hypothetical protein